MVAEENRVQAEENVSTLSGFNVFYPNAFSAIGGDRCFLCLIGF